MKFDALRLALLPAMQLACAATLQAAEVSVSSPDSTTIRFALGKLEAALQGQADTLKRTINQAPDQGAEIVVTVDPAIMTDIGAEGYRRTSSRQGLRITGGGERGAMYGVLDVAEQIRLGTPLNKIKEHAARAQLEFRAIKFNLPWSAYRTSPALVQHKETCQDLKYWEAFLDMMVENRFNVLSLWSLHPYTYMIRPKNFPEDDPVILFAAQEARVAPGVAEFSGLVALEFVPTLAGHLAGPAPAGCPSWPWCGCLR